AQKMSGILGGGPIYKNRTTSISELKSSGFTMVEVWTIHVEANGDMGFNAEFDLIKNGQYIGDQTYPHFKSDIASLKQQPTSITKVNFGLSAWASQTFNNIRDLVASQGTGPTSILYKNFKALKDNFPDVDAINFDDEVTYHLSSATQFAVMLADLGFKISICPYTQKTFWTSLVNDVNSQRPGTIDAVFLQCYAGGSGNSPCSWTFPGIPTYPGLHNNSGTSSVANSLTNWKNQCNIEGGWIWLYDQVQGTASNFATTINNVFGIGSTNPPGQATSPSPANGATNISSNITLSWTAGTNTDNHDVYFGTSSSLGSGDLKVNQTSTSYNPGSLSLNTTYYWRIDEKNSNGTTTGAVWSFTTASTNLVDHTNPPGSGTITARAQISAAEGKDKAFDNLYTSGTQNSNWSKWLDNGGTPSSSNPSWIQLELTQAQIVNKLVIISANDDYGRDPEDFRLKGSNDGSNWTTLNSWTGETFASRFQRKEFSFSNSTGYKYYKLEITKNDDNVSMTQLCEIELIGPAGQSSSSHISSESENNNTSGNADGPVGSSIDVTGEITSGSDDDWFYFDLNTAGNINISLSHDAGKDLDFWLYHESNMSNYVLRGYTTSNPETGTYNATQTGRYYLVIKDYSNKIGNYTLSVSGGLAKFTDNSEAGKDEFVIHQEKTPTTYSLAPAYPNPFNPATKIKFQLPKDDFVSLKIYDITGRYVETLTEETTSAGEHTVTWNAANKSSGIYIIVMKSGNYVSKQKVILLK
ncbi:MAG: T9SS type A sorting domain-containing protein, partial [Rhodothermaceae bacterium]